MPLPTRIAGVDLYRAAPSPPIRLANPPVRSGTARSAYVHVDVRHLPRPRDGNRVVRKRGLVTIDAPPRFVRLAAKAEEAASAGAFPTDALALPDHAVKARRPALGLFMNTI